MTGDVFEFSIELNIAREIPETAVVSVRNAGSEFNCELVGGAGIHFSIKFLDANNFKN